MIFSQIFTQRAPAAAVTAEPAARTIKSRFIAFFTALVRVFADVEHRTQPPRPAPDEGHSADDAAPSSRPLARKYASVLPSPSSPAVTLASSGHMAHRVLGELFGQRHEERALDALLAAGTVADQARAKNVLVLGRLPLPEARKIKNYACVYYAAVELQGDTPALREIGRAYVKLLAGEAGIGSAHLEHATAHKTRRDLEQKLLAASGATGEGRTALLDNVERKAAAFVVAHADALGVAEKVKGNMPMRDMMDPRTKIGWERLFESGVSKGEFGHFAHQMEWIALLPKLVAVQPRHSPA